MSKEFGRLKRKVIFQIFLIGVIALGIGVILQYTIIDGVLQEPFAEGFVHLCQKIFNLDYYSARDIYSWVFRSNKSFYMILGFSMLLLIMFYYAMTKFMRYFKEISSGVEQLAEESEEDIKLSPELDFMEHHLNEVRQRLKKREQDALESEQRKNDLVVYLAHDIKTPLTSVIGYLSLLDEAKDMPEDQREKYVSVTLEKAYRLEQLINEFFEITRFNLQTVMLNKEPINLSFMLMQMADEFYPMLEKGGRSAQVEVEEHLEIQGDPDKLARVFNNILKNAIAYSSPDSVINITASREEHLVTIAFSNVGKTIPAARLETIFEKFYRLDSARSSDTGGAGLGLAIAKEIVTAHQGTITAESENGITTFTVVLPDGQKPFPGRA